MRKAQPSKSKPVSQSKQGSPDTKLRRLRQWGAGALAAVAAAVAFVAKYGPPIKELFGSDKAAAVTAAAPAQPDIIRLRPVLITPPDATAPTTLTFTGPDSGPAPRILVDELLASGDGRLVVKNLNPVGAGEKGAVTIAGQSLEMEDDTVNGGKTPDGVGPVNIGQHDGQTKVRRTVINGDPK